MFGEEQSILPASFFLAVDNPRTTPLAISDLILARTLIALLDGINSVRLVPRVARVPRTTLRRRRELNNLDLTLTRRRVARPAPQTTARY